MSSVPEATPTGVAAHLGARLRELRGERGHALDALAARSGVSRSAISLIERGEVSPTAVVLERLAAALDVPLASLFDPPATPEAVSPVARRAAQSAWRDPQSGYVRRNVSSSTWPSPVQLVEVHLPAGATVAYEQAQREIAIHQQVWVLSGRVDVRVGADDHRLGTGDCLAMRVDGPVTFTNPASRGARYAVAIATQPVPGRRPE